MNLRIVSLICLFSLTLASCAAEIPETIVSTSTSPTPISTSTPLTSPEPDDLKPTSTPQSTNSSIRTTVQWNDYDAGLQLNIDQMTTNQDCQGLQSFFGMIAATEESMKINSGHGNEALEKYLNEAIAISGCG